MKFSIVLALSAPAVVLALDIQKAPGFEEFLEAPQDLPDHVMQAASMRGPNTSRANSSNGEDSKQHGSLSNVAKVVDASAAESGESLTHHYSIPEHSIPESMLPESVIHPESSTGGDATSEKVATIETDMEELKAEIDDFKVEIKSVKLMLAGLGARRRQLRTRK